VTTAEAAATDEAVASNAIASYKHILLDEGDDAG